MNPPVTWQLAHADPNASPITVNDLIDLLNQLGTVTIQGSYIPYVISGDTPGVDDQDKAWIELDTQGRPLSIKIYYSGNWRRVYNGMLGEIRGFSGDPTITADWDDMGKGAIGGKYDGWQICNGKNGSPDLSNQFLLGANMSSNDNHGYSSGWVANITGPDGVARNYTTGGQFIEAITKNNLPILDNSTPGQPAGLWIHGHDYTNGTPNPGSKSPIVDAKFAADVPRDWNLTQDNPYGVATPLPLWTTPKFYSLAWMIFQGY